MSTTNNEFEFEEQPSPEFEFQERPTEGEIGFGGFLEGSEAITDKSEVLILTTNFSIRGKISLVPGARLTDYIVDAKAFIAVVDVEVKDKSGKLVLKSSFLDVNRDHIELIMPADLVVTE